MNCEDQLGIQKLTIARLTEERDEARREVCQWSSESDKKFTPEEDADLRKWDCYKEETP